MPTKTIVGSVVLSLIVIDAVSMPPDFVRYVKIRSV
jgi:hypothetical protein